MQKLNSKYFCDEKKVGMVAWPIAAMKFSIIEKARVIFW